MTREVSRENSQAAEDKDPKAVRPDEPEMGPFSGVRYRRTLARITDIERRLSPAVSAEIFADWFETCWSCVPERAGAQSHAG